MTRNDNEYAWQSRPFKARQLKRREGKGKGKDKGKSKRTGRALFGEEQAQDSELWSEEDFAWWTKGRKGKKGWPKSNDGFQKGSFRPCQSYKGAGKDFNQNKDKGKDQKGKHNENLYPQSALSATEALDEKGYGQTWESDDWSSSQWLDDSLTPAAGSHGPGPWQHTVHWIKSSNRKINEHSWYYGMTT